MVVLAFRVESALSILSLLLLYQTITAHFRKVAVERDIPSPNQKTGSPIRADRSGDDGEYVTNDIVNLLG